MTTAERDFSTFNLGDNVYELAGGLIPEAAERLGVEIGDEPSSEGLQLLMDQVGTKKELRTNPEIELPREVKADFVVRSGVQKALRRSLWTPDIPVTDGAVDAFLLMGGMANWQDRMPSLLGDLLGGKPVYWLSGTRVMDSPTEQPNPNVSRLHERLDRYPTEIEYAEEIIMPQLVADREVVHAAFETGNGDTILKQFFEQNPDLLKSRMALARVANAGVVMAVQMRNAARQLNSKFDIDPDNPQVFVATDTFPVSRTEEQDKDSAHFQKSDTGFRQIVLTAKKLHEAAGGE